MTDVESEVRAFREELADLAVVDPQQVAADVQSLSAAILTAPSHEQAAVALREFADSHSDDPGYVFAVASGAFASMGMHVILHAPLDTLAGPDGLLRRLHRVAYAARGLRIGGDR